MSVIGRSLRRIEDRPLLIGEGRFSADMNVAGQLSMRIVRSPLAFGRIVGIETEDARSLPGVHAVWTYADIADIPPIDFRMTRITGLEPYRQTILAKDIVRYVGEPVAVVFADDAYIAEDAAELVFLDIDEFDPKTIATDELGLFHPDMSDLSTEPACIRKEYGDLQAAFRAADEIVELETAVGRHTAVPMETRGALATYDPDADRLTMYGAAKVPHYNRDAIARMLGRASDTVRLSEGHVGGGFGVRGELYPEDVLVCAAALRLARPVKWVEDRREHLIAANHSRDQVYRMRAAVRRDGYILGIENEFYTDQGAYVRTHGGTVSDLSAALFPGPYVVPAYRGVGHIRLTNKTPAGTYRAPGRFESTFARERLLDAIAARLQLDPVAVRRINLIPQDAMPFDRGIDALGTHVVYDSGCYENLLERTLAHLDYDALRSRIADRRANGETVGLGLVFFVEKSGLGPRDLVEIILDTDGTVEIVTGVASIGQGVETVLAQICSEAIGVPIEKMRVTHGQTDRIRMGFGAFASRVTVMTGSAVKLASGTLRTRLIEAGAALLQTDPAAVRLENECVVTADGASVLLSEIAGSTGAAIRTEGLFESDHMNYPYGIHVAQVKIDRETMGITIENYLVAYEIGRAINPMLVEGQIVGAAAQGIGGALFEEFVYDEAGQPLATSFADYLMPTSAEMPPVEMLLREDAPSPLNPLGVKGAGEGGLTAAGAALAAAVDDALGRPGTIDRLPITPSRLHAKLNDSDLVKGL